MPTFNQFAGQLVKNGIDKNMPVNNLEEPENRATQLVNGLAMKIGRTLIEETRIFDTALTHIITQTGMEFGVSVEIAEFTKGAVNKKRGTNCIPNGTVDMASMVLTNNFSYNVPITIYDREVNMAVLDAETAGRYVAQKLRTPLKTIYMERYRATLQLISDVVNGSRNITSTDRSDGTGDAVTYNPTNIIGYAGKVDTPDIDIPAPTIGTLTSITEEDAIKFVTHIEGIATDMREETDQFNTLGIDTFLLDKPYLIIEAKTLNALNNAWMISGGFKGIPTRTAREYLERYADIIEIPGAFPDIPTNETYTNKRLGAVLLDRYALREYVQWNDVESMRCIEKRSTNYSYQGSSILGIYRGAPSYAMLVNPSATPGA